MKMEERKTVCGGTLREDDPGISAENNGQMLCFCTRGCLHAFQSDPERFLAGKIAHPIDEK